jgi:phosphoglycerol transferase MdoB-like AlkP superfamily enzyme
MSDDSALAFVRNFYRQEIRSNDSPVYRNVVTTGDAKNYNIVLVLLESMSCYNMKAFGNKDDVTPALDDLYAHSLSFDNFYSDGIHTFCGIYSSLFGMPSLPNRHHMKDLKNAQPYGGLANALKKNNYQTIFFTSHDDQFDNMGGFLSSNGFEQVVSQKDYNEDQLLNALGVPDHILFEEAVARMNLLNENHRPFFATILTASNHGPYELPRRINFIPHSKDLKSSVLEYADWSVGRFIRACEKQPWFDSTIFIFTGDHGSIIEGRDIYMTYHHVPLIVYAPEIVAPRVNHNLCGQIDIFPVVMSLLNRPYTNNTFGIDILKSSRRFLTFSYDDEYGTISDHDFFIARKANSSLFQIDDGARNWKTIDNTARADSMHTFAKAIFQAKQWMIENHKLK